MNNLINKSILIILRGVSGSGKTTFAEFLQHAINGRETVVCTADDYFYDDSGTYKFDATKLDYAHKQCKTAAFSSMVNNIPIVIVANTSTSTKEYEPYYNYAKAKGYEVVSIVIENLEGRSDVHNVPKHAIIRQKYNLRNSLKL